MTPLPSPAGAAAPDRPQPPEAQSRRAVELDGLSAVLPLGSRDRLIELLSDCEVETLRHLAREGMGANTLRAMASDLAYLEAWSTAASGAPLPWPAPEGLVLRFVAHHLYDPARRAEDPSHGMPDAVEAALRSDGRLRAGGPHAPATVRRRLALWSTFHRWLGFEGPFSSPNLRAALRLAARAGRRPRGRKSAKPLTRDVLQRLIAACSNGTLADKRDAALLLIAFASGGRRRSEIAALRMEDLVERPPVPADRSAPQGPKLPVLALILGRTKTARREDDERVLAVGRPVEALKAWLEAAGISSGPVFRRIDRWGTVGDSALDGQSVNAIVKRRSALAGLDPADYSAHGLRSGYLTEAARRGVPLPEAMRQSRHRSVQQAAAYYNEVEIDRGRSARLV